MRGVLLACLAVPWLVPGCDCGGAIKGGPSVPGEDAAAPGRDAGEIPGLDAAADAPQGCGDQQECDAGQRCAYGTCVPDVPCESAEDCQDDTWCDDGGCVPWGLPEGHEVDEECSREVTVARFRPTIQCEWSGPPEGDPYPASVHVLSTPTVVDLDLDDDPETIRPSIIFVSDDGVDGSDELPTGVVRVIDGDNCAHQHTIDAHLTSHSSPPAVGDLDGDGRAEIVAYAAGGGLVAFRYDPAADAWALDWHSAYADGSNYAVTGGGWAGPSLHDLDDDGLPEALRGGVIFGPDGVLRGGSLGYLVFSNGIFPVVADVDLDGAPELVTGSALYQFDPVADDWIAEPTFSTAEPDGHTAVADLGDFQLEAMDIPDAAEIVVVPNGAVRVQTIEGTVVFGPHLIPGGGAGGPPTIADFDGDGRAEFATAGLANYVVYDLDCVPGGGEGECGTGREDGILWQMPSQDASSNKTGSSVFDFEGDGAAEAVYADECFVRVYQGATGEVIYSQYRSSCTWYENPIVADTDGDFNAELVVPSNLNCSLPECPTCGVDCTLNVDADKIDQLFAGLRCEVDADCPTAASICDEGYCRCAADDECCPEGGCTDVGWRCAPPPAGTPGAGNTCRARHPAGTWGIRVYSDHADRWVDSRRIWNQHAYAVTHVNEDGTVPATSDVAPNWLQPGLNDFRANVQGSLDLLASPDLTVEGGWDCEAGGAVILRATVCNRGTEPVGAGTGVAFRDGADLVCAAEVAGILEPAECEEASCVWPADADPPLDEERDVTIAVDPDAEILECHEGNNAGNIDDVKCVTIE